MNTSISEYSSGCESGWTTYLDQDQHYSYSTDPYTNYYQRKGDDDDEDLSMVSDASSAPPHYQNNTSHYYAGYPPSSLYHDKPKTKTKTTPKPKTHRDFCLDDTASSSIFHFSQDNVPHSDDHNSPGHVYSAAAHFENESRTKKKGLSFFKSSTKGKSSGGLLGRKRQ